MQKLFEVFGEITLHGQRAVEGGLQEVDSQADTTGKSVEDLGERFQEVGDKVSNAGSTLSKFVTGPMAAAGAAIGAITAKGSQLAQQLERQSQLAGVNAQQFQKDAFAAKTLGIEQDKLSDIYKDASDKVGDFLANEAGPLKDFFEKVAPQVGVTAKEFEGLSGKEALQKYVNTLEKAEVGQQQMTFYLEAIASDATVLAPLLANNGEEMQRLGEEAEKAGLVLGEDVLESLNDSQATMAKFGTALKVVAVQLADAFMPVLKSLIPILTDAVLPAFKATAAILGTMAEWFNKLPGPLKALIGGFVALVAAIGPMLFISGKLIGLFGTMIARLPALIALYWAKAAAVWAAMAPLLIWAAILAGLAATIYIVGKAIAWVIDQLGGFQGIWDKITGTLEDGLAFMRETFSTFFGWLGEKWNAFWDRITSAAKDIWDTFWGWIREPLLAAWEWLKAKLTGIYEWWAVIFQKIYEAAVGPFRSMWDWVKEKTSATWGWLQETFNAMKQFFADIWASIYDNTIGKIGDMYNWVVNKITAMKDKVMSILNTLSAGLVGNSIIPDMVDASVGEFQKMREGAESETKALAANVSGNMRGIEGPQIGSGVQPGAGAGGQVYIDQRHSIWRDDTDMQDRLRRGGMSLTGAMA